MDKRQILADIFKDTQEFYTLNKKLAECIVVSGRNTTFYDADDYPEIKRTANRDGRISVSKLKTIQSSMKLHSDYPEKKITILNFASATNPGGGVKKGSSAQEESLCRCSTLYPSLTQKWVYEKYYRRNREEKDNLHTDAIIYTPGVVVCKTDDSSPERLAEADWITVDVISCAAPNLRDKPANAYNQDFGKSAKIGNDELYQIHVKRARHILHIAALNNADVLVLGAFGCGAFQNNPEVVAKAYADVLPDYKKYFDLVEFAIYCNRYETGNYDAFKEYIK